MIRKSWLWAGLIVLPLLFVLEAFIYYPLLLASETLPESADSIGIPLFNTLITAPFLAMALLLYSIPAIYGYRSDADWRRLDRACPWRGALSIMIYGLPAALLLIDCVIAALIFPSYDATFLLVALPLIAWLMMLRAAMAAPRQDAEAESAEAS